MQIIIAILVIWALISVVGFVVHALFWLGIIGVGLFIVTAAVGSAKRKSIGR